MDTEEAVLYSKDKNHVWYTIILFGYSIDLLYPNFSQFDLYDLKVIWHLVEFKLTNTKDTEKTFQNPI